MKRRIWFAVLAAVALWGCSPASGPAALRGLFPPSVEGRPLIVRSDAADELVSDPRFGDDEKELVARLGRHASDFAVAWAFAISSGSYRNELSIRAIQVSGADPARIAVVYAEIQLARDPGRLRAQSTTAGGKLVIALISRQPGITQRLAKYLYARGDVLFVVSGANESLYEPALAALP